MRIHNEIIDKEAKRIRERLADCRIFGESVCDEDTLIVAAYYMAVR